MKISKKVILISVFSIFIFSSFLIPQVGAQEWTYDGTDTPIIPGFSVYPSEWYVFNATGAGIADETLFIVDIILIIIAAVRSNKGENYQYPFAIRFIS